MLEGAQVSLCRYDFEVAIDSGRLTAFVAEHARRTHLDGRDAVSPRMHPDMSRSTQGRLKDDQDRPVFEDIFVQISS